MAMSYHTHLEPEHVGNYVIMPGAPERVPVIAQLLDNPRQVAQHRGYLTFVGELLGELVTVISSLVGVPNVDIVMHELLEQWEAKGRGLFRPAILRPGTAGSLDKQKVKIGHYCNTTGAVRDGGAMDKYVPIEYPAVADLEMMLAIRAACHKLNLVHHLGISQCKAIFNIENPHARLPLRLEVERRFEVLRDANVESTSMESEAGCVISSLNGLRFGELLQIVGYTIKGEGDPIGHHDDQELSLAAVETMKYLIRHDRGEINLMPYDF